MAEKAQKLLVLQVAALGWNLLETSPRQAGLIFRPARGVFPAVTCPVQATLRTGKPPEEHGMLMNGAWLSHAFKPSFWEQPARLVRGERIWKTFRENNRRVGMMFWQQSLGESVDLLLSPAPIHTHGGGMIDALYSKPGGLEAELVRGIGGKFQLKNYWGPLAGLASSRWIADATVKVMSRNDSPDLLFSYLPHLDYDLQRRGPRHPKAGKALAETLQLIEKIVTMAHRQGRKVLVYGDYAIGESRRVLYPNRWLREAGLFKVREVGKRLYPDFPDSNAFACADHEVALVVCRKGYEDATARALNRDGCSLKKIRAPEGIFHPDETAYHLTAEPGEWFTWQWYDHAGQAPDYAGHIDIHNKPGYDPCELFFGFPPPFRICSDPSRIRGTHGHVGMGREVAWASSSDFFDSPQSLLDLSLLLAKYLHC